MAEWACHGSTSVAWKVETAGRETARLSRFSWNTTPHLTGHTAMKKYPTFADRLAASFAAAGVPPPAGLLVAPGVTLAASTACSQPRGAPPRDLPPPVAPAAPTLTSRAPPPPHHPYEPTRVGGKVIVAPGVSRQQCVSAIPPTPFGAARALLHARTLTTTMRSGHAAIGVAGARAAFVLLTGDERAEAMDLTRRLYDSEAQKPRCYRAQYYAFCKEHWPAMLPTQIRFTPLRAFIASYVIDRGNMAKYVGDIVSAVRRAALALDEWGLDSHEEAELASDRLWLSRAFPEPPRVTRGLTLEERSRFHAACAAGGAAGLQAAAIMNLSVGTQARFTEVIRLNEDDVVLRHDLGVLVQVMRPKTQQDNLKPHPRCAPRLPLHFREFDAYHAVKLYLDEVAGRAPSTAPTAGRPFFTQLTRNAAGGLVPGTKPLTPDYARSLLLRFLAAAHVADGLNLLNLNLHFARTTGFNDLANKLYLGRVIAAEAGGWEEGGCVAESYQRRSAEDLACALHRALRSACRDFEWTMPAGTGPPPGY